MATTESGRLEIRPHMRSGLILIGIGALNALTGGSTMLLRAAELDGTALMWADKLAFMAIIAIGIWISRKKIILEDGTARFFGLVSGNARAEVRIADIESAGRDHAKRGVEIKAKGETLRVRLGVKSKAAAALLQGLADRGVAVQEVLS